MEKNQRCLRTGRERNGAGESGFPAKRIEAPAFFKYNRVVAGPGYWRRETRGGR